MKKATLLTLALLGIVLLPAAGLAGTKAAASDEPWIHIEVKERGGDDAAINVNLPLALAEAALTAVSDDVTTHMHLDQRHGDLSVSDLRRMWNAMEDAGDAEFVTVEDGGETVRIYREGEFVFVKVDEKAGDENVQIRMPVTVMDALLSGEGEQLDLQAAMASLTSLGGSSGELVRVEDGGDVVRIWIDKDSGSSSR